MDFSEDLSGTAVFSDIDKADFEELKYLPKPKEIKAKFVFTEEQENDLREAFNLLDYSGEGKIKAEDFRVAIKGLGYEPTKEELQKMVNAVDKGGSGRLSFENFETAIMRKVMSLDSDADIMKSFRLFDMDDRGLISFKNLKKVTEILGYPLSDEEINEMIDDADKDFDGDPSQLGFGTKGGCEAAVHALSTYVATGGSEVVLKVDLKNAFNSVNRDTLLTQISVQEFMKMIKNGVHIVTP